MAETVNIIGIIVQCMICMTIIDRLSGLQSTYKIWTMKLVCASINLAIWIYAEAMGSFWNILGIMLDIVIYFVYIFIVKRESFLTMFATVMATQIISQIGAVIVTIVIWGMLNIVKNDSDNTILILFGYLLRIMLLYLLIVLDKRYQISRLIEKARAQYIIVIVGLLFQFSRLIIRVRRDSSDKVLLYIALTILIIGGIFGILWIIDWYCTEREKRLLWEDNDRMSKRLHKSKELIPALNSALNHLKIDSDSTALDGILEEIHQLCQEQLGESRQWDMQEKSFPSTGIHILDEQIQLYGKEAAEKSINFDVFVGAPLPEIFKERHIKELDFLRLIGDLVRNAFRAIEKSEKAKGSILLVIGCIDDIFQIDIYDDGAPFPLFILNGFGKRGNTQGGTGNGIADMLDFLEQHQATYQLTEYGEGATFSKGISIIWNGKNGRWIDSYRSGQILEGSLLLPKEP